MKPIKHETSEELEAVKRELRGTQEMLAHVLLAVGKPVEVTKESVTNGLPINIQIRVDDDLARDLFVFSLEEVTDE